MNNVPIVIFDNYILMNTSLIQFTNVGFDVPFEIFMTKLGLLIPCDFKLYSAFNLSGMMLHNPVVESDIINYSNKQNVKDNAHGFLLTKHGNLISITDVEIDPLNFSSNSLPTQKSRYVLSFISGIASTIHVVAERAQSINEAWKMMNTITAIDYKDKYRIFRLDDLIEWIGRCLEYKSCFPYDGYVTKPSLDETVHYMRDEL